MLKRKAESKMCENQIKLDVIKKATKICELMNKLTYLKVELTGLNFFSLERIKFVHADSLRDRMPDISIDSVSIDILKVFVLDKLNEQIALTIDELSTLLK